MKVLAGEIPQTADTALYQTACNTRRVSARNGEHRHIRLVALNEPTSVSTLRTSWPPKR